MKPYVLGTSLLLGVLGACAPGAVQTGEVSLVLRRPSERLGSSVAAAKASDSGSLGLPTGYCFGVHITAPDPAGSPLNWRQMDEQASQGVPGCVEPKRLGRLDGSFAYKQTAELREVPVGKARRFEIIGVPKAAASAACDQPLKFVPSADGEDVEVLYGSKRIDPNVSIVIFAAGSADLKSGLNTVYLDTVPPPAGLDAASYGDCSPLRGEVPRFHPDSHGEEAVYTGVDKGPLRFRCSRMIDRVRVSGLGPSVTMTCEDGIAQSATDVEFFTIDQIMAWQDEGGWLERPGLRVEGLRGAAVVYDSGLETLRYGSSYSDLSTSGVDAYPVEFTRATDASARILGIATPDGAVPRLFVAERTAENMLTRIPLVKGDHQWKAAGGAQTVDRGTAPSFFWSPLRALLELSSATILTFSWSDAAPSTATPIKQIAGAQLQSMIVHEESGAALVAGTSGGGQMLWLYPEGLEGAPVANVVLALDPLDDKVNRLQLQPWNGGYVALALAADTLDAGMGSFEAVYFKKMPDGTWTYSLTSGALPGGAAALQRLPESRIVYTPTTCSPMPACQVPYRSSLVLLSFSGGALTFQYLVDPVEEHGSRPLLRAGTPITGPENFTPRFLASGLVHDDNRTKKPELLMGGRQSFVWDVSEVSRSVLYRSPDDGKTWFRVYIGRSGSGEFIDARALPLGSKERPGLTGFALLEANNIDLLGLRLQHPGSGY